MARGGKRAGAGRKKGGTNRMSNAARAQAKKTGLLPHEFLLAIMQNDAKHLGGWVPTMADRIEAAKVAAPYYAPRLSAVAAKIGNAGNPWEELLKFADEQPRTLPSETVPRET